MTTQHASELLAELLQNLMDVTGEPPEANCSCHLSPPCSDCVDYGSWREVFSACQSAIARATMAAPSTSAADVLVEEWSKKAVSSAWMVLEIGKERDALRTELEALKAASSTSSEPMKNEDFSKRLDAIGADRSYWRECYYVLRAELEAIKGGA